MNNKLLMGFCAATVLSISGCATVADLAGADSATLNMNAAQGFNKTVQDARTKNALDTSSATYRKVNAAFIKLKP